MSRHNLIGRKERGQGMMEFALALPILLLVLFGLIEVGRLMFMYTMVSTASREAARYGSSVGSSSGVPRYMDCNGIRNYALRLGQFAGMNAGNILISYDDGSGTQRFASCEALASATTDVTLGDRIIIQASVQFNPMSGFIPGIGAVTLNSTTRRTILKGVVLVGNTGAGGGGGGGGGGGTNNPPTVTVNQPADNSDFAMGATVTLQGTATDIEDGDISSNISWSSSIDGALGTGASISTSTLSVGTHTVIATVSDSNGFNAFDNVVFNVLNVSNLPPSVTITSPPNGHTRSEGTSIAFAGSASDAADGDVTASLEWTSNLMPGVTLGTGGSFATTALVEGTHTITATATDTEGEPGSASITVVITSGSVNSPPSINVTSSPNGFSFAYGTIITFTGTAVDPEDGNISASQIWTSSRDGSLGSGTNITVSTLSVGVHTITASVTDSGGLTGSGSITITINNSPDPSVYANVSATKSGSTCQNATVSWTTNPTWSSNPGEPPVLYQVTVLSGGSGTTTGLSYNTGSLSNNTNRTVQVVAQFPGGPYSNALTINFKCQGGNITDVTHSP